jgi:hypothetical protein
MVFLPLHPSGSLTTSFLANRDAHSVCFRTLHEKAIVPETLFWIATITTFLIANAPPAKLTAVLLKVLQCVPTDAAERLFPQNVGLESIASHITNYVVVPAKELVFLFALFVIVCPLWHSLSRSKDVWREIGTKHNIVFALTLFLGLALLVFPYSYPHGLNSHFSGLSGLGERFGAMSMAPFQEWNPIYYRRFLKPAIAHFVHLDGYVRYYLFSLLCTFLLTFMVVAFLESRSPAKEESRGQLLNPSLKWLVYLSLMTSSFVLVDFQWPGYSDSLSFGLLLLAASVPMTPEARLAVVVLCLINHDAIALAMVPVILFYFPRGERVNAVIAVVLFFGIVMASYSFSPFQGLQGQGIVREDAGSVWEAALHYYGLFLAGLFFSYKLFWIVFALGIAMLWQLKEKWNLTAVIVITSFPVLLTFFAWDTTRIAGWGWFGIVIAVSTLLQKYGELPKIQKHALLALACANLLIPSYNVVLFYKDSLSSYPYPGLYMLIDSSVRLLLSQVVGLI